MRIAVIGGSAAGLVAALLLGRAGHRVDVLDRDDLAPAPDVETAAATAFRPSAPQLVQPHAMLPLCRLLLRERLPDVYRALLRAGAVEAPLATQMAPTLTDRSARPGDEDLTLLMTRRATVDWVLRGAAAGQPGVTLRGGQRVIGLLGAPGDPPSVVGVRTDRGELAADLVVDASGRRTALDRWLADLGARPSATVLAECGLAYFGRQYRLRTSDAPPGAATTRMVVPLDEFLVGIWGGDNASMQIVLAPLAADRRFRGAGRPEVFTSVLRSVPYCARWLDVLEPITEVRAMGGLHNRLRRLVVAGRPVVHGLHAIGDSLCTTNPTFGRGLGLIMRNVADLLDALAAHPADLEAQARAMDRAVTEHVEPWYADQAAGDAALLAQLRHAVFGAPPVVAAPHPQRLTFTELRLAGAVDPVVLRAFWKVFGMLERPDRIYRDAELLARARRVLAAGTRASRTPQPSTEQLVKALEAAGQT
jgi:2-polyprenyl-6-methoxyphenol hydroxylase-like FAD-dependent oxidoreductase